MRLGARARARESGSPPRRRGIYSQLAREKGARWSDFFPGTRPAARRAQLWLCSTTPHTDTGGEIRAGSCGAVGGRRKDWGRAALLRAAVRPSGKRRRTRARAADGGARIASDRCICCARGSRAYRRGPATRGDAVVLRLDEDELRFVPVGRVEEELRGRDVEPLGRGGVEHGGLLQGLASEPHLVRHRAAALGERDARRVGERRARLAAPRARAQRAPRQRAGEGQRQEWRPRGAHLSSWAPCGGGKRAQGSATRRAPTGPSLSFLAGWLRHFAPSWHSPVREFPTGEQYQRTLWGAWGATRPAAAAAARHRHRLRRHHHSRALLRLLSEILPDLSGSLASSARSCAIDALLPAGRRRGSSRRSRRARVRARCVSLCPAGGPEPSSDAANVLIEKGGGRRLL